MHHRAPLLLLPFLATACIRPPAQLSGGPLAQISVAQAQKEGVTGRRVRWGGSIVATNPQKDQTCFEVVSRPLDARARPRQTDETDGRFLACASGFYDPAVYAPGRELTVIGMLQPETEGKIGEFEYRYPQVRAEQVYLWPKRERERVYYYYYPWVDPFWYPYWGPWPYRLRP